MVQIDGVTRLRHPGRGRGAGRPTRKGRQSDPSAVAELNALLGPEARQRDQLIEDLHRIQDNYGQLHLARLAALAELHRIPLAEVYEVASFYAHFDVVEDGASAPDGTIRVCSSLSCWLAGSVELKDALTRWSRASDRPVRIVSAPCMGRCAEAPAVEVNGRHLSPASAEAVIEALGADGAEADMPLSAQTVEDNAKPEVWQAIRSGERSAESVIAALSDAGLRGLGGAGFPTARKWEIVRAYPGPRFVAVNADEGEPGTFKDRLYLERHPHQVIEGMLIAASVVGAERIYVYIRDEYPEARRRLARIVTGLESEGTLEPGFVVLRRGAGAYICGEESAMIESIEGKRGMPRLRPPFVAEVGLFGRPTLEHNMETLYWVRDIVEQGPEWFTSHGRHDRKGLRSFSVSGRIRKPGVHLAPAGITMRELIDEYCGGMLDGHEFHAYFPGGASGGILPASMGNIPLDFDTLNEYGCFIGSAAIVVLSDKDDVKHAALNAMRFFAHESCGQCTPCRVGTVKAVQLMEQPHWDQPLMQALARTMMDASICGLGQAAPNPMLCVMKYFPEELTDDGER